MPLRHSYPSRACMRASASSSLNASTPSAPRWYGRAGPVTKNSRQVSGCRRIPRRDRLAFRLACRISIAGRWKVAPAWQWWRAGALPLWLTPSSQRQLAQPKSIGDHRRRAEGHGRGGEHRPEQQPKGGVENARRQRHAGGVVHEREEEVLPDIVLRGPAQSARTSDGVGVLDLGRGHHPRLVKKLKRTILPELR